MLHFHRHRTGDGTWVYTGGFIQYAGDKGQSFYSFNQAAYGFAGVSVSRYLTKRFDLVLSTSSGEVGNADVTGEPVGEGETRSFLSRQHAATLALKYNFIDEEHMLRPYVFAGPSFMYVEKRHTVDNSFFDALVPTAGFGINVRVSTIIGVELKETFMYTSHDELDYIVSGLNDAFAYHSIGVNFNLKWHSTWRTRKNAAGGY